MLIQQSDHERGCILNQENLDKINRNKHGQRGD